MKKLSTLVAVMMVGCATPYGRMGFMGGYEDLRLDETTFRVSAIGNGFASQDRVLGMVHLRCAEVTVENGYDYFEVLTGDSAVDESQILTGGSTTGRIKPRFGGGFDYSETYSPPQAIGVNKYRAMALIRVGKGERPANAFDAKEVIKFLRPKIAEE